MIDRRSLLKLTPALFFPALIPNVECEESKFQEILENKNRFTDKIDVYYINKDTIKVTLIGDVDGEEEEFDYDIPSFKSYNPVADYHETTEYHYNDQKKISNALICYNCFTKKHTILVYNNTCTLESVT